MSDQFVGEIRLVPFNFAPNGWAFCNGQLLPISQNTALFSLLGTFYGGDGKTNFALPNLQGQTPMDYGSGTGLTPRSLGETGGEAAVTLSLNQIPAHSHVLNGDTSPATSSSPTGNLLAAPPGNPRAPNKLYSTAAAATAMLAGSITAAGGGQSHNNLQPYLVLNFVIALQGIYPSRN